MAVPQRTALTLPDPRGVAGTIEMAKWAEAEGYDDLWFADSSGVDALTTAAAVALWVLEKLSFLDRYCLPQRKSPTNLN